MSQKTSAKKTPSRRRTSGKKDFAGASSAGNLSGEDKSAGKRPKEARPREEERPLSKTILVDATQQGETRVVVAENGEIEEFEHHLEHRPLLRGNIYLGRITRVEASLQAAFVEYGGGRQGFLAFGEIHPDYYQIPVEDREALLVPSDPKDSHESEKNSGDIETFDDEAEDTVRPVINRRYKIQEVIKRRQVILVQVVKEERRHKGVTLTSYLSLAGRYCVLMPNSLGTGGVSRKITGAEVRKKMRQILQSLDVPANMALILRTAGSKCNKAEIARDYRYLVERWNTIRSLTLESCAPALVHSEGELLYRVVRDFYDRDTEEILVEGKEAWQSVRDFMKSMIPSHTRRVKHYRDTDMSLFQRHQIESRLAMIYQPSVPLRSGGSLVINQTEALVSIDVNSGRSNRERHIKETALRTNLEAAQQIARQLRLRDLAGLIAIDFIDMENSHHNETVRRQLCDCLSRDRARLQIGRISPFGLLEMSRQRISPSVMEIAGVPCAHCGGTGVVVSPEIQAKNLLRALEYDAQTNRGAGFLVRMSVPLASSILRSCRPLLAEIESRHQIALVLETDTLLSGAYFQIFRTALRTDSGVIENLGEQNYQEISPFSVRETRKTAKTRRRDAAMQSPETGKRETDEEKGEKQKDKTDSDSADVRPVSRRTRRGRGGASRKRKENGEHTEDIASVSNSVQSAHADNAADGELEERKDFAVSAVQRTASLVRKTALARVFSPEEES